LFLRTVLRVVLPVSTIIRLPRPSKQGSQISFSFVLTRLQPDARGKNDDDADDDDDDA
jgi:hypothetical protein